MDNIKDQNTEYIYGINAVTTLLEVNEGHRKIYHIFISDRRKKDVRINNIQKLASKKSIKFSMIRHEEFREITGGEENTQNLAASVSPYNPSDLDHYLKKGLKPYSRLIILDQVTDMGNFGSIIRNCRAFGFDGIVIGKNRSVPLNNKVSRLSAGALEGTRIFRVTNLAAIIKKLKSAGFWIYGTTLKKGRKVQDLQNTDFAFPLAIVLGSEDRGMSRIVTGRCDLLVSIDLTGEMESLNVSVASGIILYHIQEKYRGKNN